MPKTKWKISASGGTDATTLNGLRIELDGTNYELRTAPPNSRLVGTFSSGTTPTLTGITMPGAPTNTIPWTLTITNTTSPISGSWTDSNNQNGGWESKVVAKYQIKASGGNDAPTLDSFHIDQDGTTYTLENLPTGGTYTSSPGPPLKFNITFPTGNTNSTYNPWWVTITNTTSPISGNWGNQDSAVIEKNEEGSWTSEVLPDPDDDDDDDQGEDKDC